MSLYKFKSSRCSPCNQSTQRRRKVYRCCVSSSPIKRAKHETCTCQPSRLSSSSRWKPNSLSSNAEKTNERTNGFISPQMSNFHRSHWLLEKRQCNQLAWTIAHTKGGWHWNHFAISANRALNLLNQGLAWFRMTWTVSCTITLFVAKHHQLNWHMYSKSFQSLSTWVEQRHSAGLIICS